MAKEPKEKCFQIHYRQTEYRTCTVWAESERKAREQFRNDETDDDKFMDADNRRIIAVDTED